MYATFAYIANVHLPMARERCAMEWTEAAAAANAAERPSERARAKDRDGDRTS